MTQLFYQAAVSIQNHSPWALLFAFAVGAVSSLGPCTPARLMWLTNAAGSSRRPWPLIGAFVLGTLVLYVTFALVGMLADVVLRYEPWIYTILGVASVWFGIRQIWDADHHHAHTSAGSSTVSLGGAFLQGVGFGALVQPCCTPVLFMVATTVAPTSMVYASVILILFGIGHALPALAVGPAVRVRTWIEARGWMTGVATAFGGVSIAIGGYFLFMA
jgi:cytochrome c biogenesis protein CcdA